MEKMKWDKLSMQDRAFLIREAVRNGITDINSIRDTWEHRFDGESNQPTEEKPWYKKLASAISEGSRMARDARIGDLGAEQVRELYREGKTVEAQELAKQYAKANIAGMTMAAGAANTAGLAGDLAITVVSTLADTAVEGNTDNFKKNLAINAMFDVAGKGVADVLGYVGKKAAPHVLRLLPEQMVSALNKGVKEIDYHKLTDQEWDDLYFKALKSGNTDEVQRLRDLHFKVKAPNTKVVDAQGNPAKVYRGQKDASVYKNTNTSRYSDDRTRSGSGYFSTNSPSVADSYAKNFSTGAKGDKLELYLNLENPKVVDAQGRSWKSAEVYTHPSGSKYGRSTDEIYRNAVKDGNDGVIVKNVSDASIGSKLSEAEKIADDYIATAGRSKLSDPITYDDAGNIISLSQRDNFLKSDIRYALFPAAAVGAGLISAEKGNQNGHQFSGEEDHPEHGVQHELKKKSTHTPDLSNPFKKFSTAEDAPPVHPKQDLHFEWLRPADEAIARGSGFLYDPLFYEKNKVLRDKVYNTFYSLNDPDSDINIPEEYEILNREQVRKLLPKRDYIGGKTPKETRDKVASLIPGLIDSLQAISSRHKINPELLHHRISKEGYYDKKASKYNYEIYKDEMPEYWNTVANQEVNGFSELGLDDAGELLEKGLIKVTRPISYETLDGINEKNRNVTSVITPNLWDALEIKAGDIKYRQEEMRKRGISAEDLDTWTNAAYNLGLYHNDLNNEDWIRKNYTLPSYENLFKK